MVNARGKKPRSTRSRYSAPTRTSRGYRDPSTTGAVAAWAARRIGWQPPAMAAVILGAAWSLAELGLAETARLLPLALAGLMGAALVAAVLRRSQLRPLAFTAARMAHRFAWRPAAGILAVLVVAALLRRAGWETPWERVAPVAGLALTFLVLWWALRHVARPHSAKAVIRRRAELDQRTGGIASRLDIAEHASPKSLKLKAWCEAPGMRCPGIRDTPCEVCGITVSAEYMVRTGLPRHGHHGSDARRRRARDVR